MTTIGVLGTRWRADVTPGGTIRPWDAMDALGWYVAADDRWHRPDDEPSTRQVLVEGTPVVETRVRIPGGDAIHRAYAVADDGGLTVVQVENASSLPIAVAFAGPPLLSMRPPTDQPIAGIELPAGAVLFPIGHHASITVAFAHDGRVAGALPADLPPPLQVARGWTTLTDRACRLVLPDSALVESVVHERCELLLAGPAPLDRDATADPVGLLLGAAEIVRCGGQVEPWVPEVADAVHRLARAADVWDVSAAFDAAAFVLARAGEERALSDLARVRQRIAGATPAALPPSPPSTGVRRVAWVERRIATGPELFPGGIPREWWGQHLEVHRLPTGPRSAVSFALRWHGERPAVLWEQEGDPVRLAASVAAPGWASSEPSGETLWPAPAGAAGAPSSRRWPAAPSRSPDGRSAVCDSLVALPAATDGSCALFAKNSDRPPAEPQDVHWSPPRRDSASLRTTHIEIAPSPVDTIGCVLSRPRWCWGAEHGVNEAGVAMGNESIFTTLDPRAAAPALIGMDLVRLALERADTAADAVQVVLDLLERYGQGGSGHDPAIVGGPRPYWSSFLVADPADGYVIETSGTTAAVERVERSRAISNRTTIPAFDAAHRHPRQPVERLVDPRWEAGRAVLANEPVTVEALATHLRSHDSCADPGWSVCMHVPGIETTTASMIAELRDGGPHLAHVLVGRPCEEVYLTVEVGRSFPSLVGRPLEPVAGSS